MEQYLHLQQQQSVLHRQQQQQSKQSPQHLQSAPVPVPVHVPTSAGRVALLPGESVRDYPLFSEGGGASGASGASVSTATLASMPAISVHESAVASLFFSARNIEAVQDALRYRVNRASLDAGVAGPGYIIGRQNERELGIIMRGVYQQYGRNMPTRLAEQTRDLNSKVLDFCVPRVLQEVMAYHQYRVDISTPRIMMSYGEIAGTKGDKQLGLRAT